MGTDMLETRQQRIVFLGNESRPLDDKRRLTVPSKWRPNKEGDADEFVAFPNPMNASIIVYPPEMRDKLYEKVSEIGLGSDPEEAQLLDDMFGRGEYLSCDRQGRIMLSETLLEHAGIKRDARLVGGYTKFLIWSPETHDEWKKVGQVKNEQTERIAAILKKLGL